MGREIKSMVLIIILTNFMITSTDAQSVYNVEVGDSYTWKFISITDLEGEPVNATQAIVIASISVSVDCGDGCTGDGTEKKYLRLNEELNVEVESYGGGINEAIFAIISFPQGTFNWYLRYSDHRDPADAYIGASYLFVNFFIKESLTEKDEFLDHNYDCEGILSSFKQNFGDVTVLMVRTDLIESDISNPLQEDTLSDHCEDGTTNFKIGFHFLFITSLGSIFAIVKIKRKTVTTFV